MPAHATHMNILDLVIEKVKTNNPELGRLLEENRDIAYLGSIAPDIYFFAPDISDAQRDVMHWILDIYDKAIKPIINIYEDYIEPVEDVLDDITEPAEVVLDALTCGALTSLADDGEGLINDAKLTMQTFLISLASNAVNFFQLFTPPIQEGKTEEEWYWFDMLHYRNTADYVQSVVSSIPDSSAPSEKYEVGLAYAMGHLTHIAADVTGHAFVNEIVGGPYRSHNRRHHIMENFMDVWTHNHYKDEELIGARLHRKFEGGDLLDSLGTLRAVADGILDPPARLNELFSYMEMAFVETYRDRPHPTRISTEFLTTKDISIAYWLTLATLKISTDCLLPPLEPPYGDLLDEINNQMDDLRDAVQNTPGDPPSAPDSCWSFWEDDCDFDWDTVKDFFDWIGDAIGYLGDCIVYALNVLKELLELIHCTITEALFLPIKAIIWIIRALIQELYNNFRDALVIAGIALPSVDYLNSPLGRQFTQARGPMESFKIYPHRQSMFSLVGGLLLPEDTHLEYPTTSPEQHLTMNGPYAEDTTPDIFIEGTPMDQSILNQFEQATNPEQTREIGRSIYQTNGAIGNAVDYSVQLILGVYNAWKNNQVFEIPNWNLDADRGYGYKCWRAENPDAVAPDSTTEVEDFYRSGD